MNFPTALAILEMRFTDVAQKYAKRFAFICCLKVCNKKCTHLRLRTNHATRWQLCQQPPSLLVGDFAACPFPFWWFLFPLSLSTLREKSIATSSEVLEISFSFSFVVRFLLNKQFNSLQHERTYLGDFWNIDIISKILHQGCQAVK